MTEIEIIDCRYLKITDSYCKKPKITYLWPDLSFQLNNGEIIINGSNDSVTINSNSDIIIDGNIILFEDLIDLTECLQKCACSNTEPVEPVIMSYRIGGVNLLANSVYVFPPGSNFKALTITKFDDQNGYEITGPSIAGGGIQTDSRIQTVAYNDEHAFLNEGFSFDVGTDLTISYTLHPV